MRHAGLVFRFVFYRCKDILLFSNDMMMKKIRLLTALLLIFGSAPANKEIHLVRWLKAGPVKIYEPAFSGKGNLEGEPFKMDDLLESLHINFEQNPGAAQPVVLARKKTSWQELHLHTDSLIAIKLQGHNLMYLATYIDLDRSATLNFHITTHSLFELSIDGDEKHVKKGQGPARSEFSVSLHQGKHLIGLKLLNTGPKVKFKAKVTYKKKFDGLSLKNTLDPVSALTIHDILDGTDIQSASISPTGKYTLIHYTETFRGSGETVDYTVLKNLNTLSDKAVFRNQDIKKVKWLPATDRFSYIEKTDGACHIYLYDIDRGEEMRIASGIENLDEYAWGPNESFMVYSAKRKAGDPGKLKRIYGPEDRIPGFRNRSYLYLLDVNSGDSYPLTAGNLSTRLHDIRPDGKKILFSTSRPDYTEVPFSKQNLYELDLQNLSLDTIWKNKRYPGMAEYSPRGDQLLIQGGPLCFGNIGVNISNNMMSNNYDGQLYRYDLSTNKATPLTKKFAPSINAFEWPAEDHIYLSVTEKDYANLYRYSIHSGEFKQIELKTEVLGDIDFSKGAKKAVYTGSGMITPEQLYAINLKTSNSKLIDYPKEKKLTDVAFGTTASWSFTNSQGKTIDGRVYYPPNFQPGKKYPLIVYYYGGTSPVERSFDGRYPKNIWAGKGYIVYVLQPSGAIGYGQEFSALHVNGWGKEQLNDIIEGTQKFLKAHPSVDKNNIGAIGASYGGYTTMMLQTQTDLFKTAVAHAGISSISSYWGEGYWGYTYSAVASANSYPWNNKALYVEKSPLFNADQFSNSILLLHGTEDTNVPVGESLQYYAALKILGKEAELVLVEGQNHWIIDYEKRIKWHHTILAWLDKKLKDQPEQWRKMYPNLNASGTLKGL